MFKVGDKIYNIKTKETAVVTKLPKDKQYLMEYVADFNVGFSFHADISPSYFENGNRFGSLNTSYNDLYFIGNWQKIQEPNDILKEMIKE